MSDIDPAEQMRRDYCTVFDSEEGQKVLRNLLARYYFCSTTFSPDALQMAHDEGKRYVVLDILRITGEAIDLKKIQAMQAQAYKDYDPTAEI